MALANPLLDFDTILFVKRAPGMFPHMSDQHYGWWSRGGGGVYVLEDFKSGQPRGALPDRGLAGRQLRRARTFPSTARRCCSPTAGSIPDLQDETNKADKASVPEDAFYHIYEMNVDGTGRRQLTHGKYDDFDPRYLPGGDIVVPLHPQGHRRSSAASGSPTPRATADLPDSYVRCGGDNYRPVPVFTLHAMDADGRQPPAALRLRELRVDARRWPTTAACSTRAGITSTASTATSSACGRPTRTAPTRSSSMAITPSSPR